jgi:hypothetical protein
VVERKYCPAETFLRSRLAAGIAGVSAHSHSPDDRGALFLKLRGKSY